MPNRSLTLCVAFAALALFSTAIAGATSQRTAQATVSGQVILVHGTPFFPVMLIDQCSGSAVAHARALGINLILNENCAGVSPSRQLAMIGNNSLAVLPIASRQLRGSRLVGWTYPDEPENNGWTPESLRAAQPYPRGNTDGLLSFMTTAGGFAPGVYRAPSVAPSTYGAFAHLADVAGFDLYPLGHCQKDLTAVYDAQRMFVGLAGDMPTFQWIETGPIKPTYCGGFTMTPQELSAEVWLAVAGGARGIGFFTHTWSPDHNAFDVTPELQQTMKSIAGLLRATKPGLLGTTVPSGENSPAIKILARTAGNANYVFAVNTQPGSVKAQGYVPQLRNGRLEVLGEHRSVAVANHRFIDSFSPLVAHVYVQKG